MCGTHARTKFVTLVKFSRISASWPLSFTSRNGGLEPAARVVDEDVDPVELGSIHDAHRLVAVAHVEAAGDDVPAVSRDPRRGLARGASASRSQIATSAPNRANVSAIVGADTDAAPVTTATRPVSSTDSGVERHRRRRLGVPDAHVRSAYDSG